MCKKYHFTVYIGLLWFCDLLHICSVQVMPGSKAQADATHRAAPTTLGHTTWGKNSLTAQQSQSSGTQWYLGM